MKVKNVNQFARFYKNKKKAPWEQKINKKFYAENKVFWRKL